MIVVEHRASWTVRTACMHGSWNAATRQSCFPLQGNTVRQHDPLKSLVTMHPSMQKSDNGDAQPSKMQRTDAAGAAAAVPMPHMQASDMVAHSQAGYQQPGAIMQLQQPYPAAPAPHGIPSPGPAQSSVTQLHASGIPHPVPGPYMPMHVLQQQAGHAAPDVSQQHPAVPEVPSASAGDGVPAPPGPGDTAATYGVPPPQAVLTAGEHLAAQDFPHSIQDIISGVGLYEEPPQHNHMFLRRQEEVCGLDAPT